MMEFKIAVSRHAHVARHTGGNPSSGAGISRNYASVAIACAVQVIKIINRNKVVPCAKVYAKIEGASVHTLSFTEIDLVFPLFDDFFLLSY